MTLKIEIVRSIFDSILIFPPFFLYIDGIIEEVRRNNGQEIFTTTELPRKNKKLKTFLQPDFSIDVLEEPAAEPVSTFGAGWVPLSVEQVIGQLFVYNF